MYKYLSIKESAIEFHKSEITIRRIVTKIKKGSQPNFNNTPILKKERLSNGIDKIFILQDYLYSVYINDQVNDQVNDQMNDQVNDQATKTPYPTELIEVLKAQIKDLKNDKDRLFNTIDDLTKTNKELSYINMLNSKESNTQKSPTFNIDNAEVVEEKQTTPMSTFVPKAEIPTEKKDVILEDELIQEEEVEPEFFEAKREDIDMDKRRKGLTALDKDVRMSARDWLKVFEQKSN